MGRWLILTGLIFVVIGLIVHYAPGVLNWFGKLPGDIRMETERGKFFLPITSMVIISIVLTILINLFRR